MRGLVLPSVTPAVPLQTNAADDVGLDTCSACELANASVLLKAETSNVAPPKIVRFVVAAGDAAPLKASVPAATRVLPVYVAVPLNTNLPGPCLVIPPETAPPFV